MGVVYKAHDEKLDRDVALNFFPHNLGSDKADTARFIQETKAAAALNHPNICTIHAIEEVDGKQFIMVNSKNQIKVMDFGLAKLRGSFHLTKTSSTVGTVAYMAPEMTQGGDADARSDIFSFGIVLYEMEGCRQRPARLC